MPADQTTENGSNIPHQADNRTPMLVEHFMKLVSPNLATQDVVVKNTVVETYQVKGESRSQTGPAC